VTREIRPETAEAIREKYQHFPGLVEHFIERGIWAIAPDASEART
jgi:hypothetical protein